MTDEHGAEGCYAGSVSDDPSRREPPSAPIIEELRARLVADVESEVRATRSYLGKERPDARGIAALGKVPRHRFVPPEVAHRAYENVPLPIGHGQTISQPYIVAVMTDLLETQPTDTVLEIGGGGAARRARLRQCRRARRQRQRGLARGRPLRRHHRDRGGSAHSRAPLGAAQARPQAGNPRGRARRAGPDRGRAPALARRGC